MYLPQHWLSLALFLLWTCCLPLQAAPKAAAKPARVHRAPSSGFTVEVIRGSKVTETNFK